MNPIKTLKQRDIALYSVSAILLLDTLASGAAVGSTIIFWWILLGIFFFIPNALITAELGSNYPGEGGIYIWVKKAFGKHWAARVTWSYWVNYAIWLPSIAILFTGVFIQIFDIEMSLIWQVLMCIVITWVSVFINTFSLNIGKWIPNLGAIIKILFFSVLIIGGFIYGLNNPSANPLEWQSLQLEWGSSLQYLPVLIYGMLGFELISAHSSEMYNPKRDVPRGIFISGTLIISFYILATIAILLAIPSAEINLVEGLMNTLYLLLGDSQLGRGFALVLGVGLLFTFISNMVTWALGCNRTMAEAAKEREMPAFFGIELSNGSPIGAAVSAGVVSTLLLIIFGYLAGTNEDLFWNLFAFSAVLFLLPYIGMSLAFMKLRVLEPERTLGFTVPGGKIVEILCVFFTLAILIGTIILLCYVPELGVQWSILLGSGIVLCLGELFIRQASLHSK